MHCLEWITVKELEAVFTVSATAGKHIQIENRGTYGLSFCKSGKITYTHRGKKFVSTPDRAVILPMGATYTLYNNSGGEFPLFNFTCMEPLTDEFIVIPLGQTEEYFSDYEKIRKLATMHGSRLKMMSLFYGVLERLFSESQNRNASLRRATQYIIGHLDDTTLSNSKIAAEAGVCESYLRRMFREAYKTTPKQYVIEARIQKAGQALRENRGPVTEISYQCGFSSVYHFCRAFKQYSGLTPSEYRNRYGLEGI